jgi:hypothetical protein
VKNGAGHVERRQADEALTVRSVARGGRIRFLAEYVAEPAGAGRRDRHDAEEMAR